MKKQKYVRKDKSQNPNERQGSKFTQFCEMHSHDMEERKHFEVFQIYTTTQQRASGCRLVLVICLHQQVCQGHNHVFD